MTTIFLRSYDVYSGNSAKGVIRFDTTIQDHWTVVSQYTEKSGTITIAAEGGTWMDNTNNTLLMKYETSEVTVVFNTSIGSTSNQNTIITEFNRATKAAFDDAIEDGSSVVNPFWWIDNGIVRFETEVPIDLALGDSATTFDTIWGSSVNINDGTSFSFPFSNITDRLEEHEDITDQVDYLEMSITEATSYVSTSHNTTPTLICNVTGDEMTGQHIFFPKATNNITFEFRAPYDITKPLYSNKDWSLCLSKYVGN